MKKRTGIFLLLTLASLALVGFGINEVKLLHNSKVIDLSKAIEIARPGGDAGEQNDTNATDNPAVNNGELEKADEIETVQVLPKDIKIAVNGKTIRFDGRVIDEDKIEEMVRLTFRTDITYELVDEYAESHVYKRVIETLERLKSELGINYTVE